MGDIGLMLGDFFTNTARGMLNFFTFRQYEYQSIQDERKQNVAETGNYQGIPPWVNTGIDYVLGRNDTGNNPFGEETQKLSAWIIIILFIILLIRR
jgi:hypothetical protein